jgi:hypothetical protein
MKLKKRLSRLRLIAWTFSTSVLWHFKVRRQFDWSAPVKFVRALQMRQIDRRPGSLWWKRMRLCQVCVIYDRKRRACGKLDDTLGCGCAMFVKNADPKSVCWLWENTDGRLGSDFSFREAKQTSAE